MQDLEKRIENIEKKLNIENSVVLTGNEKIVWEFILQHLPYLFEIIKYEGNSYSIAATGWRYGVAKDNCVWGKAQDEEVLEAFLSLGVYYYELKEKRNNKNETH